MIWRTFGRSPPDPRSEFVASLVRANFRNLAESNKRLCSCRSFTYEQNLSPNYSDPEVQSLYLCRYGPAYFAEYYYVFEREVLPKFGRKPLNILSVGTGYGLDLAAFSHCTKQLKYPPIKGFGVDVVGWNGAQSLLQAHNSGLYIRDAGALHEQRLLKNTPIDLVVFPRSLGEINNAIGSKLIESLSKLRYHDHHVILSFSRDNQFYANRDDVVLKEICDSKSQDFESTGTPQPAKMPPKIGWKKHLPWWSYPNDLKDRVKDIATSCSDYGVCSDQHVCKSVMTRSPILFADTARWQIAEFKRKT